MMKKIVSSVLIILLVVSLINTALASADMTMYFPSLDPRNNRTITVKGSATVQVAPDIAMVTLRIRESSLELLNSQGIANEKINAIVAMLKEEGVESKDISTTNMSINSSKGYTTTCAVNVIVRDLDKAGMLIDKALTAGAYDLGSIQYTREDYKEVVDQSLTLAIENARRKAGVIAAEGGVELDVILNAREESSYFTFNRIFADEAAPGFEGSTAALQADISLQGDIALQSDTALQSGTLYQVMTVVVTFACK